MQQKMGNKGMSLAGGTKRDAYFLTNIGIIKKIKKAWPKQRRDTVELCFFEKEMVHEKVDSCMRSNLL